MKRLFSFFALIFAFSLAAAAQTTAFNFQGRLNDGTTPANGRYDLEFRLYDALTGGNLIGTNSRPNLTLINGVFSTQLDFGTNAFDGSDRFIEIRRRSSVGENSYVVLGARQQILSVPYTIRSKRATLADTATYADCAADSQKLGGVTAANYLLKNGNGSQLTNVAAVDSQKLGGVAASQYVQQGGLGAVKAWAVVQGYFGNSRIYSCYNSTLTGSAATTLPCGITLNRFTYGGYGLEFNFPVTYRPVTITAADADWDSNEDNVSAYLGLPENSASFPNRINVRTYHSSHSTQTDDVDYFTIVVY